MKAINKLAVLIGLASLLPLAVSAKTPEQAYIETASKAPGVPVPVAVVMPRVANTEYAGAELKVAFTVDAKGQPVSLQVVTSPDAAIAKVIADAVSKWRFAPAQRNGVPVATKVVLPVQIVDAGERLAAN